MTDGWRVSAVIPTRHRPVLLARAIASVLAQSRPVLECLVVGEESDPGSAAVVARLDVPRVRFVALPGRALGGAARNAGVAAATGDAVAFLDDDDEWYVDKLARQLPLLGAPGGAGRTVVAARFHDEVKRRDLPARPMPPGMSPEKYLFDRRHVAAVRQLATSGLLTSRALALAVPFDATLPRHQDWDWVLRCAAAGAEVVMPAPTLWRKGAGDRGPAGSVGGGSFDVASIRWAERLAEGLVTPRELSGLCLTTLLPGAAKAGDWAAVRELVTLARRRGRVAPAHALIAGTHVLRALRPAPTGSTRGPAVRTTPHAGTAVQVVTQLERAGAQTVAQALERVLGNDLELETHFLYAKSESDLFAVTAAVLPTRPRSARDVVALLSGVVRLGGHEVVIAHTHWAIALVIPAAWARRATKRVAVHHWPESRYPLPCRVALAAYRRFGLITDDVYVSPDLPRAPRGTVIRNPLPCTAAPAPAASADAALDLMCVARHAPEKNLVHLVSAMALLRDRHLTLVGSGDETPRIVAEIARLSLHDVVTLVPSASNDWVRAAMASCRLVVLPSLWEATPMVLLEALSVGAPIAVSAIPELRQFAEAGVAVTFSPTDVADVATAVRSTEDGEVLRQLRAAAGPFTALFADDVIRGEWMAVLR